MEVEKKEREDLLLGEGEGKEVSGKLHVKRDGERMKLEEGEKLV